MVISISWHVLIPFYLFFFQFDWEIRKFFGLFKSKFSFTPKQMKDFPQKAFFQLFGNRLPLGQKKYNKKPCSVADLIMLLLFDIEFGIDLSAGKMSSSLKTNKLFNCFLITRSSSAVNWSRIELRGYRLQVPTFGKWCTGASFSTTTTTAKKKKNIGIFLIMVSGLKTETILRPKRDFSRVVK